MHYDDNTVFQLGKMECNYSDYIVIQNKLENTEKEVILLKHKIDNNESLLQQKINIYYDKELDRLECFNIKYVYLIITNGLILILSFVYAYSPSKSDISL